MFSSQLRQVSYRTSTALSAFLPRFTKGRVSVVQNAPPRLPLQARSISTTHSLCVQSPHVKTLDFRNGQDVRSVNRDLKTLSVTFEDDTSSAYPYVWLRDNCQCNICFNKDAIARQFLICDLNLDLQPKEVKVDGSGITVEWSDGHVSVFTGPWLHQRAFTKEARARHRSRFMLTKIPWSVDFVVPKLDYNLIMIDDRAFLDWLVALEKYGVLLITNAPRRSGPINDFIERIGFIKPTHYGVYYEIRTHVNPNNLAYTPCKLGLHTDLPYYEYPPGTTWLHCIRQHEGEGGANDLSDGLMASQLLRERHPHLFDVLVKTPIYFQDKGFHFYDFDKITKTTTITLDERGQIRRLHISSQARDSIMDLSAEEVSEFYLALKTLNNILYETSISVKTMPGDILVIDNSRVLHGRTPFVPDSAKGMRQIANGYVDWDELRSKRRILQDKFNVDLE